MPLRRSTALRSPIGGQAACVAFISPGQVNALVPSNVASGSQPLTVTVDNVTSAAYSVTVNPRSSPGWTRRHRLASAESSTWWRSTAMVVTSCPRARLRVVNSRPAQPGDEIVLYGIGFGPVTPNHAGGPACAAGERAGVVLRDFRGWGACQASCSYAGLAPNYTGLVSVQCRGAGQRWQRRGAVDVHGRRRGRDADACISQC
jgi:uncharacterized protein (TIGR03437 family)